MKASARRSVSYVVEACDEERAHRLGVNSLAIDPNVQQTMDENTGHGGVLFSAGRDGVVASWDLHFKFHRPSVHADWELDHDYETPAPKATNRAFTQMHTDWVNDIVVCKDGRVVVSASSDRTVKLWSVNDPETCSSTIGWHNDYVKCLASANQAGWVASGGFDKRVNIWDLEKCQASAAIHTNADQNMYSLGAHNTITKTSIYAMAVNPSGKVLATGSPDKVVRLWDPRSGQQIGRLTGHTDNIRTLLISEDGSHILSGSSDSTIKLWSVKAQRCLATYETHADSVWSLYSDDPELKIFYAGSRDGLVTKTEISGCNEMDNESECIGLFKEKSGVSKIVVLQDKYIWTATSSSDINRWLSIPSRESRQTLIDSAYNIDIPTSASAKLPPARPPYHSQYSEPFVGSDNLTLYAKSVMSIPISYQEDDDDSNELIQPLRNAPDGAISGKPGITAHLVLQNRRHVLTQDTNGEIGLWDIVKCTQVKKFGKRPLQDVAQEVNGMDCAPAWCTVDTKIGAITVQMDGFTCFDCEMYADEADLPDTYEIREDQRINLGKWVLAHLFKEFLAKVIELQHREEEKAHDEKQERKSSSTTVIRSADTPPPPDNTKKTPKPPLTAITTNINNNTAFPPNAPMSPGSNSISSGPFTAPPTTSPQDDYFSGAHHPTAEPTSPVQPPPPVALSTSPASPTGNFINRLKHLSVKAKISKSPSGEENDTQSDANLPKRSMGDSQKNGYHGAGKKTEKETSTDSLKTHYTPPSPSEFPPLSIPSSTTIIITEESAEASTGIDLYRGTAAYAGIDAESIAHTAPSWLLAYLYHNKIPNKDAVKLTFSLSPHKGSKMPELPAGGSNRLLANRVLRVRKLIHHVGEKLGMAPGQAVQDIELLCCGTILPLTMTLASIKQHIMKSSGDILLTYRYISESNRSSDKSRISS
ncbi:WD40 repeat-like protein [Lichtheimia hyalospora FSU 10163]|nr:WD40 repeat-like protein [Lichtheimia hyalospora FSU 10163]